MKNKPTIAIPPQGCESYLTAGKEYPMLNYSDGYFFIINDIKTKSYCRKNNCPHLNGLDWILK